jgi:outer membrane lipoprotein SlyB
MRRFLAIAAIVALPAFYSASAEAQSRGTLGGAAVGGVAGAVVGGPVGAAVGAVGGAIVGNQVSRKRYYPRKRVYHQRRYR